MMRRRLSPELAAVLPWLGAAFLWFGVIAPMRAGQETRLAQQGRIRQDRVKSDREVREMQSLGARIGRALGSACRASADPAALRQRAVAATRGLSLSPFSLSVSSGPDGGASVEAEGSRGDVQELLRRLGDPARGGFVRSVSVRDKGARWGVSLATGVLDSFPGSLLSTVPDCSAVPDPGSAEASPTPLKSPVPTKPGPARPVMPVARGSEPTPEAPSQALAPASPFTLVAFLMAEGKTRVSLRVGEDVRVVSVGDQVDGWTCVSIDRDEGATFTSPSGERVVLKASPPQGPNGG